MQINIAPPAAAVLLGSSMRELARRIVPLEDVFPPLSDGAAWAWQRLAETHGRVRVETLCNELGWSRKRLAARFRDIVGLPPKTAARLLRLEWAIELAGSGMAWAEVAYACGYFDQSHLANEFRQITGASPTQYLGA